MVGLKHMEAHVKESQIKASSQPILRKTLNRSDFTAKFWCMFGDDNDTIILMIIICGCSSDVLVVTYCAWHKRLTTSQQVSVSLN